MANSVDPDQAPRSVASDLGLHYLQDLSVQILSVNTVCVTRFLSPPVPMKALLATRL